MSNQSEASIKNNCNIEGHNSKPFIAVCISSSCTNSQKLICTKCILDGHHKDHEQEIIYVKDFVEYQKAEIFDIPLWKKEGENIFNKICDWVLDLNQVEREEKIEALFSAFRKNINMLIDEAEKKYKEKLGRDSDLLMELTDKFLQVSPINTISEKIRELSEDKLPSEEFEKYLSENIIHSESRKLQIEELEETFKDIIKIEQSLNFASLSKQLIRELPTFLRADSSLEYLSPCQSPRRTNSHHVEFSRTDSVDKQSQFLPPLKKQASSSTKREKKRIVLLGKSNIGKSTLISTLIHREFQSDISAIIQRNMVYSYDLALSTKKILMTLQEISGDEEITTENKSLLKNVDAAVLLYDSDDSLDDLDKWVNIFIEFGLTADQHINFPFILTRVIKSEQSDHISEEKITKFNEEHAIRQQSEVDPTNLESILTFLEHTSNLL